MVTFNSLYGIQKEIKAYIAFRAFFQFPLWDTKGKKGVYILLDEFQFPLWDTAKNPDSTRYEKGYFNSLYGILVEYVVYLKQNQKFQFPLWDTE